MYIRAGSVPVLSHLTSCTQGEAHHPRVTVNTVQDFGNMTVISMGVNRGAT
jgi:hypothetical protein